MKHLASLLLVSTLCFAGSALSAPSPTNTTRRPYVLNIPYVPAKKEYNLELGSAWEENSMYWLGASFGFHSGTCLFSGSQSCQQYTDLIFGVAGRDGRTNGFVMPSLRWQFVDLSDRFVSHARVMMGAVNLRDEKRNRSVFGYGIGYGITTSMHKRLDIKFEVRVGQADEKIWGQTFVGLSLKVDEWVDYFGQRLKGFGAAGEALNSATGLTGKVIEGTVRSSGKIIKGTVGTTKKVLDTTVETSEGIVEKGKETIQLKKKENP